MAPSRVMAMWAMIVLGALRQVHRYHRAGADAAVQPTRWPAATTASPCAAYENVRAAPSSSTKINAGASGVARACRPQIAWAMLNRGRDLPAEAGADLIE